jgi:superfamily I DNA/RNA helicase
VKRLASRKLAVLHQFAVLPKSERAAFIGAYFNGTQRIERPPKDLDTWRKRLASIGDRQVAEDQRRAIFDERFSASYVIEGLGGTGKTEVIARRYLALHMIFEVAEDEILLVSAHHQSLGVLQQRIVDVSAGYARAPQARTVHSLAERIVRQFAAHLPFSPPLHDTKEAAAKQRLCQILSQFTELPLAVIEEGFDALTREIHRATLAGDYPGDRWAPWRECGFAPHNPRAWRDVSPNKKSPPVAASALIAAAKAYDNWKNENRLWDFDDRLTFASALLPKLERDGVLEWARIGWSHVLIDEAQDIPWTGTRFSSRLSQDFLGMWRSIRISSS